MAHEYDESNIGMYIVCYTSTFAYQDCFRYVHRYAVRETTVTTWYSTSCRGGAGHKPLLVWPQLSRPSRPDGADPKHPQSQSQIHQRSQRGGWILTCILPTETVMLSWTMLEFNGGRCLIDCGLRPWFAWFGSVLVPESSPSSVSQLCISLFHIRPLFQKACEHIRLLRRTNTRAQLTVLQTVVTRRRTLDSTSKHAIWKVVL